MTIKHRVKLFIAKIKWFIEAIDVVVKGKHSNYEKIKEKRLEIQEELLKIKDKETDYARYELLSAKYDLINYVIKCLKD